MPQNIAGTFASTAPNGVLISDTLSTPAWSGAGNRSGTINVSGDVSASNPVQLQFSDNNGQTWSNAGGAFTAAQTNLALNLSVQNRQYRLTCNMGQAGKSIAYSVSAEG